MSEKEIIENQVDAQSEEVEVENDAMESTEELAEAEAPTMEAMHGGMKKKKMEAMHGGMKKKKMEAMDDEEEKSVAAVDKASDATGSAPKRSTAGGASDASNAEPSKLPGTKSGMINAMYHKMNGMSTKEMKKLMNTYHEMQYKMEGVEYESTDTEPAINYQADFSGDLDALISNEATLSEEFKDKAAVIFEAAIKSKLSDEIDRLEEKYNEELTAEVDATKADLVEKVDNYLNYVVENWMTENQVAIQQGLRTEIAENFMTSLKDLFTESYIDVPESKVDLVDELSGTVDELEDKLNSTTAKAIEMAEQLEGYQKEEIIREASKDLADTQVEKLKKLVEDIDFENEETFTKKVSIVKESHFSKKVTESKADDIDESYDDEVETSDVMAQYISAIKKQTKQQ
tara:strand:+ start:544 stop:1749 length:1206 start_codon:yes stop_codon:yes gene_type:complete